MCSRGTLKVTFTQLNMWLGQSVRVSAEAFVHANDPYHITGASNMIKVGDRTFSVIDFPDSKELRVHIWGIPGSDGRLIANARSDKMGGYWHEDFTNRRCAIPMTGFYERHPEAGPRVFTLDEHGEQIMLLAGVYTPQSQLAIITVDSTGTAVEAVHHRMPVIFPTKEEAFTWVEYDPKVSERALLSLLKPYAGTLYRSKPKPHTLVA